MPNSKIQNHLLATLPADAFERIAPFLDPIFLSLGEVLYEAGAKLQHIYFPTTAIISVHNIMENGSSIEIIGVGNEGMLGISLLMGGDTLPGLAVVNTAGHSYRLKAQILLSEFNSSRSMMNLILSYTQALIVHISQNVVCNRYHTVEQQLCRWLLLTLDRLPSNELTITQELIASMLGVRREGITEAAGKLQRAGMISYRRGHISVLDRSGLKARVCECYDVVKSEQERLLCNVRYDKRTVRP
ncbi:CRP-like cAMP-binding protein [Candidatus Methylobacter favarea]|uniref:CRP-like cAMP-binding protein n=1 Tax=Candidatus Methylobacter favarea TaxID=2707345 RepID=A0A8S0W8A8_9GAMM|nr:Crp/Fnr family transcriptional regulator [Candidatus Methylobacter favarea]CAA9888763.1 CRP-like cAMP-binding protein [Candidatus Methylobacter favarea]